LSSILILAAADVIYQGIGTLNRLDFVERERDRWQRPSEIIRELKLKNGSVVADLGCGAGYFSLKLSSEVGAHGRVIAVDVRRLSLAFLWIRSLLRGAHNISIVHGEQDNPRLPAPVDAVLIVNTYHELAHPHVILDSVQRAIAPGGHLVISDHGPHETGSVSHEITAEVVEAELIRAGFEIQRRKDRFAEEPNEGWWWLIVARSATQPK
jgi:ubiquinone/menaquinone biosynthesis C-methylase UbiE